MGASKSLEIPFYLGIIEKKLTNISKVKSLASVFPPRAVRLTILKVKGRVKHEGIEFLTKTMPNLRKSLDKALAGEHKLNINRFRKIAGSELPKFLGELFQLVFDKDGWTLQDPNVDAVQQLRRVLDPFYKLEIKYHEETEREVLRAFIATEDELIKPTSPPPLNGFLSSLQEQVPPQSTDWGSRGAWTDGAQECRASYLRGSRFVDQRFICPQVNRTAYESSGDDSDERMGRCGHDRRANRQPDSRDQPDQGSSVWLYGRGTVRDGGRVERDVRDIRVDGVATRERSSVRSEATGVDPQVTRVPGVDSCKTAGSPCPGDEANGACTGKESGWRHGSENSSVCGTRERIIRLLDHYPTCDGRFGVWLTPGQYIEIAEVARTLISSVLASLDIYDIVPRHGPGCVATGEKRWEKWSSMHPRFIPKLAAVYPYDQMFYWSPSHLSDELFSLYHAPVVKKPYAQIVLVPKDSRGPRVISEEMLENQYIQQGQARAIRRTIESHDLTRGYVNFSDQTVNGQAALKGSLPHNDIATMDLKDASDRVSLELVRVLWPEHICEALEASRSECTMLPKMAARYGLPEVLDLKKFAPMGSSLCFPVMALTIWALSTSALVQKAKDRGRKHRESVVRIAERDLGGSVLVYGDDVITNGRDAAEVMNTLERFGLKLNPDKCCLGQLFKESCGKDGFRGVEVQPLRIRVPWSLIGSPKHLESYCEYANAHAEIGDYDTAEWISQWLEDYYGPLVRHDKPQECGFPCLDSRISILNTDARPKRRWNRGLQTWEYKVLVRTKKDCVVDEPSWRGLLRWAAETGENPVGLSFVSTQLQTSKLGASLGYETEVCNEIRISDGVRNGQYAYPEDSYLSREWRCG